MVLQTNYTYGKKLDYNGETCTVVSNTSTSDYVTVETADGEVLRLKKNLSLFDNLKDRYNKWKEENNEKILAYQEQGEYYSNLQAEHKKRYKDLCAQMSLFDENSKEYADLYKQSWAERFGAVADGNRSRGYYLSAFIAATDTHWC